MPGFSFLDMPVMQNEEGLWENPGWRHAAASTVEALMYSLRERGVAALREPDTRRRLSELSKEQLVAVGDRLLVLKIKRAWTDDEIKTLLRTRAEITK